MKQTDDTHTVEWFEWFIAGHIWRNANLPFFWDVKDDLLVDKDIWSHQIKKETRKYEF